MTDTTDRQESEEEQTQASTRDEPSDVSEKTELVTDQLAEAKAETQKMKEQWIRTAADFDNFRKRARKEIDEARKSGREDWLKDFLPIFDNLERAVMMSAKATDLKAVGDGISMILKQFLDTLNRTGITRVATLGVSFDPQIHEAIQQVESDEPPGTVLSEVQPGYISEGRLVRAALVVVAKPKSAAGNTSPASASAKESDNEIGGVSVETSANANVSGGSESGSNDSGGTTN